MKFIINLNIFKKGAFRPPFGGFKNNPITITKLSNTNKLPISHTWYLLYIYFINKTIDLLVQETWNCPIIPVKKF